MTQTAEQQSTQRLTAAQRLDMIGADELIARIEDGATQDELAAEYDVRQSQISAWLHSRPDRSARTRLAQAASAEALLGVARKTIRDAPGTMAEISRARALAQEYARLAAIRNPLYRERSEVTLQLAPPKVEEMTELQLVEVIRQGQLPAPEET
jgi:transcriptional regulator with XRE-family HTH domain